MRIDFEQKRLLNRRRYSLVDNGVHVEETTPLRRQSYVIGFETLARERFEIGTSSRGWFWAGVIGVALAVLVAIVQAVEGEARPDAVIVWLGMGSLFLAIHWTTRETFIGYPAGSMSLLFWKDRPNASALESFIDRLQTAQVNYLQREYAPAPAPPRTVVEDLERLAHLRERGALTDEEFERMKRDLISPPPTGFVGFN
jgi:hypothetical protein